MNRTLKGAWFGLAVPCVSLGWYFCGSLLTNSYLLTFLPIVVFLLIVPVVMFVVLRKKQSPAEVVSDERDNMIKAKAVSASFVSVLVMLVVLVVVMVLAADGEGMVNAFITIPFSVLILLVAIAVYSLTTLIQYGRGIKDGQE